MNWYYAWALETALGFLKIAKADKIAQFLPIIREIRDVADRIIQSVETT